MTAYITTPEQHAQIVDALERNVQHKYPLELRKAVDTGQAALAMLKAVKPVEPRGWQWFDTANFRKDLPHYAPQADWSPLYTPTKD